MKLQAFNQKDIDYARSRSKADKEMDQIVQYLIREFGGCEVPLTPQDIEGYEMRGMRPPDDRVHLQVPPQLHS